MSQSGSFSYSTAHQNAYTFRVEWRAEPDAANNRTTVVFTMRFIAGSWVGSVPTGIGERTDNTATVNGQTFTWHSARVSLSGQGSCKLGEKTVVIPHEADGTKTFRAVFTYRSRAAIDGLTTSDSMQASANITLAPISRGASFSLSPTAANMGEAVSVTVAPEKSGDRYTLGYTMGEQSGVIAENTASTALSWTPPLSLAAEIPTAVKGNAILTLRTLRDGHEVGSVSRTLSLTVPQNENTCPVVSVTALPHESYPAPFQNIFIRGLTRANVTVNASAASSGGKALSSVASVRTTAAGQSFEGTSFRTQPFPTAGLVTLTTTVTDRRGFRTTARRELEVYSYSEPAILPPPGETGILCLRTDEEGTPSPGGNRLFIAAGRRMSSLGGRNEAGLRFRYKRADDAQYSAWTTILSPSDETEEFGSYFLSSVSLSPDLIYAAELSAYDDFGRESTAECRILSGGVTFHLRPGGQGAAFGKASETDRLLDVAWNSRFRGDMTLDGTLSGGSAVLDTPLPVASGGTGGANAGAARAALLEKVDLYLAAGTQTVLHAACRESNAGSVYLLVSPNHISAGAWIFGGTPNATGSWAITLQTSQYLQVSAGGSGSDAITVTNGSNYAIAVTAIRLR